MAENGQDNSDQLKNIAGSRPSSASKGGTMHWFAYVGPDPPEYEEDSKARLKSLKDRENEERHKKLEELKAQAIAAQRFKEKKEMERRQRIDDLRNKEDVRRQQVEERKKAINDAERDRLESILKRNQEREARIEAKKRNERHSMVFAFGSSTPRMLEPTDSVGSFWGHRRATSTQNIPCTAVPLTRRQSERELDGGSKKRATSAGGLERSVEDMRMSTSMYEIFNWERGSAPSDHPISSFSLAQAAPTTNLANIGVSSPQVPAGCASGYVGRRRTDLMPTIPSKDSPSVPPRKSFTKSPAPSRPSSSLSQQSTSSITSSVNMRSRPIAAPRRQRPVSIAVTGISSDMKNGTIDHKKSETKPPLPKTRRSSFVKSTEKLKKRSIASPTEGSPKSLVSPTNVIPVTHSPVECKIFVRETKIIKEAYNDDAVEQQTKVINNAENTKSNTQIIEQFVDVSIPANEEFEINKKTELSTEKIEQIPKSEIIQVDEPSKEKYDEVFEPKINKIPTEKVGEVIVEALKVTKEPKTVEKNDASKDVDNKTENENSGDFNDCVADMNTSMTKIRINTEEEAKAALAERRRLAREEAERQAELERRRIEEEQRIEIERQQKEEEQQRILIEKLRAAEQERLEEAIREAQKREEEERLRKEEENRMKLLKEEAERKAREEAERQKAELQERLKNEEKEREARRKRVEAIMLRTRGKNSSSSQSQADEKNEDNKQEKINGSKVDAPENGHKNDKEIETVNNIIPVESLKNANTVNVDNLSTDDTINSNNAWQHNTQTDLLM